MGESQELRGWREVEARIQWRTKWGGRLKWGWRPEGSRGGRKKCRLKWGGRLKRGERPEGSRGQKKVEAKMGWEDETGWDAGGKLRPEKSGG